MDFTGKTVVDLFGGSGLVSHTITQNNPAAKVIYNDFDNYQSRIDQIEVTEQLRKQLLSEVGHLKKSEKITGQLKQQLIHIIQASNCTDWITLSSWLLFSGKYAHNLDDLASMKWYFRVPGAPLCADGYLSDVTPVQKDFRELLAEYQHHDNVVYIADPPYIMTNQMGYSGKNDPFFRLKDAIDLTRAIYQKQVLYFSSPKSESEALFEVWQPKTMHKTSIQTSCGSGNKVADYLFVLNWPEVLLK